MPADRRNIFSINQSRHRDLSSMPSSPWPMRCDERGVDNSECPSVSVLYHYPSQNRSKPSKKRNPLSCIHCAWWSSAPSVRLCCRLWLRFDLHQRRAGFLTTQKWNQLNSAPGFSISATGLMAADYECENAVPPFLVCNFNIFTKQLQLLTSVAVCVSQREPRRNQKQPAEGE